MQQGLSMEQYMQFTGQTMDQFKEQVRPDAITRIKSSLVLEAIAKEENIEVTDADVDAELEKMAAMYNMKVEDIKKYMQDSEKETMKKDIAIQKAVELVMENRKERAKAKRKTATAESEE
jgi:trigger factor